MSRWQKNKTSQKYHNYLYIKNMKKNTVYKRQNYNQAAVFSWYYLFRRVTFVQLPVSLMHLLCEVS